MDRVLCEDNVIAGGSPQAIPALAERSGVCPLEAAPLDAKSNVAHENISLMSSYP